MVTGTEAQHAADLAGKVGHRPAAVFHAQQQVAGPGQQRPACLGQLNGTPDAVEQPRTQLLLQGCDALAHRWLGAVESRRGTGEGALFGYRGEGLEVVEIHPNNIPKWNAIYEYNTFEL